MSANAAAGAVTVSSTAVSLLPEVEGRGRVAGWQIQERDRHRLAETGGTSERRPDLGLGIRLQLHGIHGDLSGPVSWTGRVNDFE